MDAYVIVNKVVEEEVSVPVVQGIDIRFEADLKKLRELPYAGEFKSVQSESFKFVQDGIQRSIHIKVQEALSNPGPIGVFLHFDDDEGEGEDDGSPSPQSKLSLNDWTLGVILPQTDEKHIRSMRGTFLGLHGMGWPSFIEAVPPGTSSIMILVSMNRVRQISIGTK